MRVVWILVLMLILVVIVILWNFGLGCAGFAIWRGTRLRLLVPIQLGLRRRRGLDLRLRDRVGSDGSADGLLLWIPSLTFDLFSGEIK